jgi:propionyl-CoA carboxylase alpha chain
VNRLLIANRGEIARRIIRTARAMGLDTVAVYADGDRDAPFVREADVAVSLPGTTAAETYLDAGALIAAARRAGADAVHPGYGFLAENAGFARAVLEAGYVWVGPSPETITAMGDKIGAKARLAAAGVPTLPTVVASGLPADDLAREARRLGFPVLVKAAAGGGGRGMRVVGRAEDLAAAVAGAGREAAAAFGDGTVFLEPYLDACRHVEVQILGDRHGRLIHCFERECSIQRRHQKIIEEAPSPAASEALRASLCAAAVAAGRAIGYVGAGTVEFLLGAGGRFYFLEVNTRLQVEHPVTEAITGLDLVGAQLRVAGGEPLDVEQAALTRVGHAIEARLYAEDPDNDFLPSPGRIRVWEEPAGLGIRVDAGVTSGTEVSGHFDSLLAKVIAHAATRAEAARVLARALERLRVHGVRTNRDILVSALRHPAFLAGDTTTDFIERHRPARRRAVSAAEVREAAVAAALAGQAARHAASPLASVPAAWRNNRAGPPRAPFRHAGTPCEVEYQRQRDGAFACGVGDWRTVARIVSIDGDAIALEIDGVRRRFTVAADGADHWVQTAAGEVHLTEDDRFPAPPPAPAVSGGCVAPMPGRVVDVCVAAGDPVEPGQTLVVLEAMKMECQVKAAGAGRVREVRVQVGRQVDRDEVLLVVATGEDGR